LKHRKIGGLIAALSSAVELLGSERTDFLPFALHISIRILSLLALQLEAMTEDAKNVLFRKPRAVPAC
jgi:hypothetical protein